MMNQPLFDTYLIKPRNQDFVNGKASLPVSLVFPEGILKIHKLAITINIFLLIVTPLYTPFLVNELLLALADIESNTIFYIPFSIDRWILNLISLKNNPVKDKLFNFLVNTEHLSTFIIFIYALVTIFSILMLRLILIKYEPWLAKRILSKGGKIVEGLIHQVKYVIVPEGPDETEILFELPTPDGNSIQGKLCCNFHRRTPPIPGNKLKFLYLNKQCYFFL